MALVGAGLSAESGIPTFRGPGGLWTRHGEPIPRPWLQACHEQTGLCDCMVLVGTSGTVRPASALPLEVKERGGALTRGQPPGDPNLTSLCDAILRAPAAQALPHLVQAARQLREASEKLSQNPHPPSTLRQAQGRLRGHPPLDTPWA